MLSNWNNQVDDIFIIHIRLLLAAVGVLDPYEFCSVKKLIFKKGNFFWLVGYKSYSID